MKYPFNKIEQKWQDFWKKNNTYQSIEDTSKPKFYILDMFPYPSGVGLHVGHPLGYIASDIIARYKKHNGFNILHPMGYDSFGLPAEQYAVQTGTHPTITTEENILQYKKQLDKIGFCFDWSRKIKTSDPSFYKWTQWIFIQLFHSWYDYNQNKAKDIKELIKEFNLNGNQNIKAECDYDEIFSKEEWISFPNEIKEEILLHYRLAFLSKSEVNWCPALGTVLANDEVKNGVSERGQYPVEQKKMIQWSLRISAYAERLLNDLESLDWSKSIKEAQKNWIGKSKGASIYFNIESSQQKIEIFTTRPDTIFGVSFLVLAPEHEFVSKITTNSQKKEVENYIFQTKKKSERDRLANIKTITGVFTGSYAIHPLTKNKIPIWIGDYVLSEYGTGAIMAVPCSDQRDWNFATYFKLPIPNIIEGHSIINNANESKEVFLCNSSFLNKLSIKEANKIIIEKIEAKKIGISNINYKLRNAVFGRQRYWGEPIPIYFENGIPKTILEKHLPLQLPKIDSFLPTNEGEPPLKRAKQWHYHPDYGIVDKNKGFPIETTTMPGWAGSNWYYLRYMDSKNDNEIVNQKKLNYWKQIDLYLGGAEHTTGHLLYFRFITKFLFDREILPFNEPAKKLVNQGMIKGTSKFVYQIQKKNVFVSYNLKNQYDTIPLHVDISLVNKNILNIEKFKHWRSEFKNAEFILENNQYICGSELEKMSKSKFNVINPDEIISQYGADSLRLHEMFLGPIELHKPWNTKGIEGVYKFLNKLWQLFHSGENNCFFISKTTPNANECKILHQTIQKITNDMESLSFNTSVSTFMIAVNQLTKYKCNKKEILEPLLILLSCHAPHITEELWQKLGNTKSIFFATWPKFNPSYLQNENVSYTVSFNGKKRFNIELYSQLKSTEIESTILEDDRTKKYLNGLQPKKIIIVPKKIINFVI